MQSQTISQLEFVDRIGKITAKFAAEKSAIDKAREDIAKGYQAAMKLTKEAMKDAKKLGFNLPVSRSMEGIRFKSHLVLDDIIIDELAPKRRFNKPKSPSLERPNPDQRLADSDPESSDLEFT